MTRYPIREPIEGKVIAYHVRTDSPDGKRMHWELPDGAIGLGGIHTPELPLFGAAAAHRWDADEPVIFTEGEKDCLAAVKSGYQAVGTVTGASSCPSRESLMVLAGMAVLLWPDADEAGTTHMMKVAAMLGNPGDVVAELGWISWPDAPAGGGAADAFEVGGSQLVDHLVAGAGSVPTPKRLEVETFSRRLSVVADSPIQRFNDEVTVSAVLRRDYGVEARPGRAVRCPRHDDRSPSLSILPDDRRAYCHSPGCELNNNGRGRDAWDLAQLAGAA